MHGFGFTSHRPRVGKGRGRSWGQPLGVSHFPGLWPFAPRKNGFRGAKDDEIRHDRISIALAPFFTFAVSSAFEPWRLRAAERLLSRKKGSRVTTTVQQLAELVQGQVVGDGSIPIRAARPLDHACA